MLAAIEIGTPDALRGIVGYVSVPCVAQRPPGLGPVSVCPAGVTPGTPLDMFPASPGEGTYAPRKDFEASPGYPASAQQLLAITRQTRPTTDPGWPQGDYVLYFWGGPGVFPELFVAKGKAVLACWACGNPPVDLKDPALEFILPLIIPPP
jgi:hypothetical protein